MDLDRYSKFTGGHISPLLLAALVLLTDTQKGLLVDLDRYSKFTAGPIIPLLLAALVLLIDILKKV